MNRPIPGVKFGNKHSYDDWGIYYDGKKSGIEPPEVQKSLIEVPFRNGLLDATPALTDKIFYKNRKLNLAFLSGDNVLSWPELCSTILKDVHGRSMHIILDTDPDYYWDAVTCEVGEPKTEDYIGSFEITCDCFPYKLKNKLTTKTITVNGANIQQTFHNGRMEVNPTFTTDVEVQVKWTAKDGSLLTISISPGTHTFDNIEFTEGYNVLTFNKISSNATVEVSYREGEL